MSDLFLNANMNIPLPERMRPQTIADVVGQSHLLGDGQPLQVAFAQRRLHSMIFWGPPGVGKTTLARLVANSFDAHFVALSAVLSGVKEIREVVEQAHIYKSQGRQTILFVDEVHRFNKAQQDAFLPHVESGLLTFIGATTENPSFEVNNALLSRAAVYVLKSLNEEELNQLITRACDVELGMTIEDSARTRLIGAADGDARRLLNQVEQVAQVATSQKTTHISETLVKSSLGSTLRRFDSGGDDFYDQISALHKSVRGSNPDAALYWFTRMLDGGADPRYLARRIVRMAWEDIGLADPRAMQICNDAATTYERLGSPEGELALAQAVLYLAVAAKSNAGYMAFNQMKAFIANEPSRAVPLHLRNAPTKLMKSLDYGKNYRYAHDEEGAYAAGENYFPENMPPAPRYQPTDRGLEGRIADKLRELRALDEAARKK
ncbi:recombination protein MgsA [Hydromonas duriensis]|uniref:Replication-associated recombination protein A n=2 Tax=Hydromonas duriensis TaxID=1527608 RepID=A0A4R6YAZ8_9BURK|nr:recombination protein MgsA [Hydromonas duriensis]